MNSPQQTERDCYYDGGKKRCLKCENCRSPYQDPKAKKEA
jgi:hypothetical protein